MIIVDRIKDDDGLVRVLFRIPGGFHVYQLIAPTDDAADAMMMIIENGWGVSLQKIEAALVSVEEMLDERFC